MNIHLLLYCGEGGGRCAQLMTSFFFSGGGALDPPAAGKKDRDKMGVGPKICGVATADGQTHNSDRSEGREGGGCIYALSECDVCRMVVVKTEEIEEKSRENMRHLVMAC